MPDIIHIISSGQGSPLKVYQYLTKADTSKLIDTIGAYNFKNIENWVTEKQKET